MKRSLLGWVCLWLMMPVGANVVITGTRVIYPGQEKDVSVHMRNHGEHPVLVQVWVDHYAFDAPTEAPIESPFVVMPPVFRMEAHEGQSVRIVYTQEPLPADRETLFQFNVLAIPPSPEETQKSYLQLAFGSKLKFFFRPPALAGEAADAVRQLAWTILPDKALRVVNPTPFHVSISTIRTEEAGAIYGADYADEGVVVMPYADAKISVHKDIRMNERQPEANALVFTYIDDYGVAKVHTAPFVRP